MDPKRLNGSDFACVENTSSLFGVGRVFCLRNTRIQSGPQNLAWCIFRNRKMLGVIRSCRDCKWGGRHLFRCQFSTRQHEIYKRIHNSNPWTEPKQYNTNKDVLWTPRTGVITYVLQAVVGGCVNQFLRKSGNEDRDGYKWHGQRNKRVRTLKETSDARTSLLPGNWRIYGWNSTANAWSTSQEQIILWDFSNMLICWRIENYSCKGNRVGSGKGNHALFS